MKTDLHEKIKVYLDILNDTVLNDFVDGETWEIILKRGHFIVSLRHTKDMPFVEAVFPSPFKEEESLQKLDTFFANPKNMVRLLSYLTSPYTSFNLIKENGRFGGFTVTTKLFPYEEGFSIQNLDHAIKAVVSAGALGFMYIQICAGDIPIEQRIVVEEASDRMFR